MAATPPQSCAHRFSRFSCLSAVWITEKRTMFAPEPENQRRSGFPQLPSSMGENWNASQFHDANRISLIYLGSSLLRLFLMTIDHGSVFCHCPSHGHLRSSEVSKRFFFVNIFRWKWDTDTKLVQKCWPDQHAAIDTWRSISISKLTLTWLGPNGRLTFWYNQLYHSIR